MAVFVFDKGKKPLMPCSETRARQLLERRRAVVHKMYPFTIRLKHRVGGVVQPVRVKLDPGSRTTGVAVAREEGGDKPAKVLCLFELTHRGDAIREKLTARRGYRRRRRNANVRYREPRFDNRGPTSKPVPSLRHRIDSCAAWVDQFRRLAPVSGVAMEPLRFNTHAMQRPGISGVEYRQDVPTGRQAGVHVGRVAVSATGSFNLQTGSGVVQGINHKHFKFFSAPTGMATPCRLCRFATASRPYSFPA